MLVAFNRRGRRRRHLAILCATLLVSAVSAVGLTGSAAAQNPSIPGQGGPGENNAITDVDGVEVGQFQRHNKSWVTGTTVIVAPNSVGSSSVRGGWPGTINTDVLEPGTRGQLVDAITLSGGSFYGLETYGGVMDWLEDQGVGLPVTGGVDPLVAGAIVYDLARGGVPISHRPNERFGYRAAAASKDGPVGQGTVGAGTGTSTSIVGGPRLKGGVGTASFDLGNGIVVGALIVVNTGGAVNPNTCDLYAAFLELEDEFDYQVPSQEECREVVPLPASNAAAASAEEDEDPDALPHTAIGVVATNANLTVAQARRMAEMGQDGLVLANLPAHTMGDGDSIFALSTHKVGLVCDEDGDCGPDASQPEVNCEQEANLDASLAGRCAGLLRDIYSATTPTLARAFGHAVLNATSTHGLTSYCDTFPSAKCGQGAGGAAAGVSGGSGGSTAALSSAVQQVGLTSQASAGATWSEALPYVMAFVTLTGLAILIRKRRRHHGPSQRELLALE